jgi:hypothetical protein
MVFKMIVLDESNENTIKDLSKIKDEIEVENI